MNEKPSLRLKFKESSSAVDQASAAQGGSKSSKALPPIVGQAPSKPRPPTIGTEPLVVKCGHTMVFDLYAKDAFREQRRTKTVQRDCPSCRQARVKAEAGAGAARRTKKATFAKVIKPRLPEGARFVATYDATQVQWTGSLTIESTTFERRAPSLNKLLHRLDDDYRASLPLIEPSAPIVETAEQAPSATAR